MRVWMNYNAGESETRCFQRLESRRDAAGRFVLNHMQVSFVILAVYRSK